MSALELKDRKFTHQEYFDLLISSNQKYEYHNGEVRMMAGGKIAHNRTKRNLFFALAANRGECKLFDSDTAIEISELDRYFFPDMSGLCGKENLTDEGGIERLLNPSLLIEVLSKGTGSFDQGEKFDVYKQLPSFKEYVTVDTQSYLVRTYYRAEKGLWRIGNYYRLDQEVEIVTFGVTVPMSVIYAGVELEE